MQIIFVGNRDHMIRMVKNELPEILTAGRLVTA